MKAKYLCLAIPVCFLLASAMSGMASADTEVNVIWNSPNPDIDVEIWSPRSNWHNQGIVSAEVFGSGGTASGSIWAANKSEIGHTNGGMEGYQNATFAGGEYTVRTSLSHVHYSMGGPTVSSYTFTDQSFTANGTKADIMQGVNLKSPVWYWTNTSHFEGFQSYSVEEADSVVADGSIGRGDSDWSQYVIYEGRAEGNVTGSQKALQGSDGQYHIGFGADISGTEGTTFFGFETFSPSPLPDGIDTLHTTVISSPNFSVFGESHTWLEDSPLDDGFDWIE